MRTLITPYGSAVSQSGHINERVMTALEATEIRFVAGISVPRQPAANDGVYAVGRIMPINERSERLLVALRAETNRWTAFNQTLL